MTTTSRKECWCGKSEPPVEITPKALAMAGVPEEVLVRHRRFLQCRAYCDIVSTIEGGQRVALGDLLGGEWAAANPQWHPPPPLAPPPPERHRPRAPPPP